MLDLVDVPGTKKRLERKTAEAYLLLVAAARLDGIAAPNLDIVSGYRDRETQQKLWDKALKDNNGDVAEARRWTAPPGHSHHETGIAVDFNLEDIPLSRFKVDQHRKTDAYKWLKSNARRFGFTPYEVEPWHWNHTGMSMPASSVSTPSIGSGAVVVAVLFALWLASGA